MIGYDYTYDADGNLNTKTDRITLETTTYTFDAENRLTRIDLPDTTIITYAYDPLGRRIEKNVDGTITRYIYDDEDILLELDGSNTVRAYYTHGRRIDEPLIMERDTDADGSLDQKVFYHADGLGSIKTLTDNTGAIVQTYLYDSFGNIVEQTGTIINPYTYTAREFDSESGLYYYRARYYDAQIGRFISEDPLNLATIQLPNQIRPRNCPMSSIKAFSKNPLQINYYNYVFSNPINLSDPSGLMSECKKKCFLPLYRSTRNSVLQGLAGMILCSFTGPSAPACYLAVLGWTSYVRTIASVLEAATCVKECDRTDGRICEIRQLDK